MIVGVGIDVVDVTRFGATLRRTPALLDRLFTPAEREMALNSQAARFAAKEALAKALGAPAGMLWQDAEVHRGAGRPTALRGARHRRRAGAGARDHLDPRLALPRRRHRVRRRRRRGTRPVIEAWSTEAVYAAESALMETLDEGELMARAVEGLAGVAAARLEELDGDAVAALVGPGNNGGRRAVRRRPARRRRLERRRRPPRHSPRGAPGPLRRPPASCSRPTPTALGEADVVLDGILGIGARPGLRRWARSWVAALPETAHVIAVDLPSGQDPMGGAWTPRACSPTRP